MSTNRNGQTATLLSDGKVLVAGGSNASGALASAEVYDPGTGTWAVTGSMTTGRNGHTATLLSDGKVLVAGGSNGSSILSSAEVYDPRAGTWSATGSMATGRTQHTATLLPSGKVLVVRGSNAEVYDPAAGAWASTGAMVAGRGDHTATLLPSGKVLVAGGGGSSALASAEVYDPGTNTWAATGSMATGRTQHTATLLLNGKVLVAGGYNLPYYLASAEVYDPATGTWASTGSLSSGRNYHKAALLPSGKVLVVGGNSGGRTYNSMASAEVYDPGSGSWGAVDSLVISRNSHTATLLASGKVMVAGGFTGVYNSDYLASVEVYDPGKSAWAATGSMAMGRGDHTATLLPSGKVLVAGGGYNGNVLTSAELYDPVAGIWTSTGFMVIGRAVHAAALLPNGKTLVVGGANSGPLSNAELYDPATGTWAATGFMALRRMEPTATLLPNGKVVVAGGFNGQYPINVEVYDPAAGTWAFTGSMATGRSGHTATLLPSGKVLVVGGYNGSRLASAEVYDPGTGTWAATGSMATGRSAHTATLLPGGKVLVTGGYNGSSLASAEVYDSGTGTWAATGSMSTGRRQHTATLLPDGKVLAVGGSNGSALASAEVYDPGTGTWASISSMNTSRYVHTATLLPRNKVLIAGGGESLSSAEGYAVAPTAPVVGSPASGAVVNTLTPVISGTAETGSTVTVFVDGTVAGTAVADGLGKWSFAPTTALSQGEHRVTAEATDPAGNTSTVSNARSFTVDTELPMAPVVVTPASGAFVNTATPVISGAAEANSQVTVFFDGTTAGTAVADVLGNWNFTPSTALSQGQRTVTAQVRDAADNISPTSSPSTFVVDIVAPDAPEVSSPAAGGVVNLRRPPITGTAEEGATVMVFLDGAEIGTTVVFAADTWSFSPAEDLPVGRHTLEVQARDSAGNASAASVSTSFTIDTRGQYQGCASAPSSAAGWVAVALGLGVGHRRRRRPRAQEALVKLSYVMLCLGCFLGGEALGGDAKDRTPYPSRRNPLFKKVAQGYDSLRFEKALQAVHKARATGKNTPQELLWLDLMEGVIQYELENEEAAAAAFTRAFARNREAQLPIPAPSAKLLELFERVRPLAQSPRTVPARPLASSQAPAAPPADPQSLASSQSPAEPKNPAAMARDSGRPVETLPGLPVLDVQREPDRDPGALGFVIGVRSEAEVLKRGMTPALTAEFSMELGERPHNVRVGTALTALFRPMGLRAEGRLYPDESGSLGKWRVRPYLALGATCFLKSGGVGGRGGVGAAIQIGPLQLSADAAYERFITAGDTFYYEPNSVLFSLGAGWSHFIANRGALNRN